MWQYVTPPRLSDGLDSHYPRMFFQVHRKGCFTQIHLKGILWDKAQAFHSCPGGVEGVTQHSRRVLCSGVLWSVWGGTLPFFRWNGCRSRYFLKLWTVLPKPYGNPKRFHTFSKNWGVSNFEISFQGVMCKKDHWNLTGCYGFLKPNSWISVESESYALPQSFHIPPFNAGVPTTLAARSCAKSVGFHLWILSAATARVGPGILREGHWTWDDGMPGWQKMTMVFFFALVEKTQQEQHNLDFPFTHRNWFLSFFL